MKRTYSLIILTLLASLFIYLFYRTDKTVVNELVLLFLSRTAFSEIRSSIAKSIPLSESIIYSLPGGLWVFCTTILSKELQINIKGHTISMAVIPILFAISLELCQLVHFTNGTFDRWDIGFSAMFWMFAYYGSQSHETQQSIIPSFTRNAVIWLVCFLSVYLAHVTV
jgi:hypothetical protein